MLSTLVLVAVVAGAIALSHLTSAAPRHYEVGLSGRVPAAIAPELAAAGRSDGVAVRTRRVPAGQVVSVLRAGRVQAVLVGADRLVVLHNPDPQLRAFVLAALLAVQLKPEPVIHLSVNSLERERAASTYGRSVAFGAVILLYLALVLTGAWVATGIVEEKSGRVVEVLLSAVTPRDLLLGKLLGIGLVALGQVTAAAVTAVAAALATGSHHLLSGLFVAAPSAIAWFAVGYALSACAFAAAASLVSRQEDLPGVTTPLNAVIAATFFAALEAAQQTSGSLTRLLSLLPPFSVMLMPVRLIEGAPELWEVAVAGALALVALVGAVALAVVAYSRSVLRTGGRVRLAVALGLREG